MTQFLRLRLLLMHLRALSATFKTCTQSALSKSHHKIPLSFHHFRSRHRAPLAGRRWTVFAASSAKVFLLALFSHWKKHSHALLRRTPSRNFPPLRQLRVHEYLPLSKPAVTPSRNLLLFIGPDGALQSGRPPHPRILNLLPRHLPKSSVPSLKAQMSMELVVQRSLVVVRRALANETFHNSGSGVRRRLK